MNRKLIVFALLAMAPCLTTHAWATQGDAGLDKDRLAFDSDQADFDELFPVTEKLNKILARITKTEVESGREIPNFIVYPYDADDPHADPFTLVWKKGEYAKRIELPADGEAILIYDPRRISAGTEEIEEDQGAEYQHFIVRYNFNSSPESESQAGESAFRLEPTDSSIYISRAILKEGASSASRMHQLICFPRIAVPKQFNGEDVKMISFQFESALPTGAEVGDEAEASAETSENSDSSEGSEKSYFLVD
jgi:hypothetical protein